MNTLTVIFGLGGLIILIYMLKKHCVGFGFLCGICGFLSLTAAFLVSRLLGIELPITPFGIAVSAIGGIPGVILLVSLLTVFDIL